MQSPLTPDLRLKKMIAINSDHQSTIGQKRLYNRQAKIKLTDP